MTHDERIEAMATAIAKCWPEVITDFDSPRSVAIKEARAAWAAADVEGMLRDAERYRWLRDIGNGNRVTPARPWIANGCLTQGVMWISGDQADAAIDAALRPE